MKRRAFIGSLGVGTLSGFDFVQHAFASGVPPSREASRPAQDKAGSPTNPSMATEAGNERRFQVLPGQRILLKGDSIAKGYAFGDFTDPSPLRTIYGMARILMKENLDRPPEWIWLRGVWEKLNPDGTPKTVDTLAGEIQVHVRRGDIRTGDWMIYEDAGGLHDFVHPAPWPNTKDIYNRYRRSLRDMLLEVQTCLGLDKVRCMSMFDYDPKYPWCGWDTPLDDGVHTGNDAIRDEANALGVPWIDMNRIMDRAEEYVASRGWGRMVGPDGIHPNVYGNYVMTLAILDSLGADIASWKIDELHHHFRHPEAGGEVKTVWGFQKDPTDEERMGILKDLRQIVAREVAVPVQTPRQEASGRGCSATAHTFCRLRHHGRILAHPATQPAGTSKVVSYELGKLFQLDSERVLLVASMREQGGHDFEVGNDGFIFQNLSDIAPERAIPLNRFDPNYQFKSGKGSGVLAKYASNGAFVPLGAMLEDGAAHPGAGTGFLLSTCKAFLPDRSEIAPNADQFLEFQQLKWEKGELKVTKGELPARLQQKLTGVGFNCLPKGRGFLCPADSDEGITVVNFEFGEGQWNPTATGKPFFTVKQPPAWRATYNPTEHPFTMVGESEPSLRKTEGGYLIYTRGSDGRGRVYRSIDGLDYYFIFDHWNWTVPQVLNQGLDGSLYLVTNTGPGWLRNPLLAYALQGVKFVDPVIIHDEKEIGDDKDKEVPFCDHGVAENVFLNGRWRHLLCYRVCDLRETNGEGAPPTPQTGLYLAELEYGSVTHVPFRF